MKKTNNQSFKLASCLLIAAVTITSAMPAKAQSASELKYFGSTYFTIINRAFDDTPDPYCRLPKSLQPTEPKVTAENGIQPGAAAKGTSPQKATPASDATATKTSATLAIPDSAALKKAADEELMTNVWQLGLNSAGIAVRFSSNAHAIGFKWLLKNNFNMVHMAGTGIRGIDLYTYDATSKTWRFIGTSQPFKAKGTTDPVTGESCDKLMSSVAVRNMRGDVREYLAYLPLYDGVDSLEIGVDSAAVVTSPVNKLMTKEDQSNLKHHKPFVFYGTSITQGGCVSRPGMAYPAIIGRRVGCESYNFGFSGNGKMNLELLPELTKIDAQAFVIDCLPNCDPEIINERGYKFISTIAKAHPDMPVYMVEHVQFPKALVDIKTDSLIVADNKLWDALYKQFRKEGINNIRYISNRKLIGSDGEATVDGIHLTDLGSIRIADDMMHGMGLDYFVPGHKRSDSPWTDIIICFAIIAITYLASKIQWKGDKKESK